MSRIPPCIFLSDLLRAHATLKLDADTESLVAALLGFRLQRRLDGGMPVVDVRPPLPLADDSAHRVRDEPPPAAVASEPAAAPALLPFDLEHRQRPAWSVPVDPAPAEPPRPSPPRPEPLFRRAWTRAIITAALTTGRKTRTLDVPSAVRSVARRDFSALECVCITTVARGCQLLVDFGPSMAPFAQDREDLVEGVRRVVGSESVAVLAFAEVLDDGVWTDAAPEPRAYVPPARGTLVAVATDLGIAFGRAASARRWRALAARLRTSGCPLVAFVPYPPRRWPQNLRGEIAIVQWDLACTAQAVRHARERSHG